LKNALKKAKNTLVSKLRRSTTNIHNFHSFDFSTYEKPKVEDPKLEECKTFIKLEKLSKELDT